MAPQRRKKKQQLPHVQGHTITYYSLPEAIPRHTRKVFYPVRPSRRPLPPVPAHPHPTSTERNSNDDYSNSIDLDDGNHDDDHSNFSPLVHHGWDSIMNQLTSTYISYKYSGEEYESDASPDPRGTRPKPDPRDIDIPVQEDCSCGGSKSRPILIFFVHHAARINVKFCGCAPDPVQLMSLGLMPASPKSPRTALHLSVMEFLVELRDTPVLSGTMMASLYNNWNKNVEHKMEATICQNLVPLYLKLLENVDDHIGTIAAGFKDNHFSCPT